MTLVLEKYSFLDQTRAKPEIQKFLSNFEVIQVHLGEIESTFLEPQSKLSGYQKEVDQVNSTLSKLFLQSDINAVPDSSRWNKEGCTAFTLSGDDTVATLIQGQYGGLLSVDGYDRGVHEWKLNIISRSSTCMVGVAPIDVSKTQNTYSTNGFYCNFNDGTLYSGPPFNKSSQPYCSGGINGGDTVIVRLDCDKHTLSFVKNNTDRGIAYTNLPDTKLYLCFTNDTTSGSSIQILN
eukprot:TRINITY_DN18582_c0_g1_i2.p1 TRINITY_DN18582_c0_g1~~TRINITY_DN18582_c0_g1_i2.p1  ORF type:complete len:236 (-),score=50.57 TRINITY_DN18582_c0_g1_i2:46-753(-)